MPYTFYVSLSRGSLPPNYCNPQQLAGRGLFVRSTAPDNERRCLPFPDFPDRRFFRHYYTKPPLPLVVVFINAFCPPARLRKRIAKNNMTHSPSTVFVPSSPHLSLPSHLPLTSLSVSRSSASLAVLPDHCQNTNRGADRVFQVLPVQTRARRREGGRSWGHRLRCSVMRKVQVRPAERAGSISGVLMARDTAVDSPVVKRLSPSLIQLYLKHVEEGRIRPLT